MFSGLYETWKFQKHACLESTRSSYIAKYIKYLITNIFRNSNQFRDRSNLVFHPKHASKTLVSVGQERGIPDQPVQHFNFLVERFCVYTICNVLYVHSTIVQYILACHIQGSILNFRHVKALDNNATCMPALQKLYSLQRSVCLIRPCGESGVFNPRRAEEKMPRNNGLFNMRTGGGILTRQLIKQLGKGGSSLLSIQTAGEKRQEHFARRKGRAVQPGCHFSCLTS